MASDRSSYLALPRTAAPVSALPTPVVKGWRQAALITGYLLLYLLLDWASMIHPFLGYNITPWSPPPGLSLALLFVFGVRYAPLLFVAGTFSYFTSPAAPIQLPGAPFFLGSALAATSMVLMHRLFRRYPEQPPAGNPDPPNP